MVFKLSEQTLGLLAVLFIISVAGAATEYGDSIAGVLGVKDNAGNSYLKNNTILNTSTVTVGRNPNGSIALTAAGTGYSTQNTTIITANAVYRNTNTTARLIICSIRSQVSENHYFLTDSNNPPTAVASELLTGDVASTATYLMGIVLPGNYFKITIGTSTIRSCMSWE